MPVKVGLAIGAFASRAFCVAVEMGFEASVVLSTLPRPTAPLDTPDIIPVKAVSYTHLTLPTKRIV